MSPSNENRGNNIQNHQVNQQVSFMSKKGGREKFAYFLAGFFEGEGSLWASCVYQPRSAINVQVTLGFSIYQHVSGMPLLEACQNYFRTGRIYLKSGSSDVYVYEINCRRSIREKVFPFMENYVLPLGCKFNDSTTGPGTFSLIKQLLYLFDQNKHLEPSRDGIIRCIEIVYATTPLGKGKKRKRSLNEIISLVQQSRK